MSAPAAMSIEDILKAVGRLPSPPRAVVEIVRTLEDGNASAETLARQIETDVGLLASVLRLVNSSYYAINGGISSVRQAIVLLGFSSIRNLVCVNGISDYFHRNGAGAFHYAGFLRHSIGVGCVAKQFAKNVFLEPDTAFVAGMLHDVGKFALAATAPNEYRRVAEYMAEHDCHASVAEMAVIGMDHAEIGAHLAQHWHFPDEICRAIRLHHLVPGVAEHSSPLADLIHVSNVLAHAMELGASEQVPPLSEHAMLRLRLSLQHVAKAFGKIEEAFSDYSQMMGV